MQVNTQWLKEWVSFDFTSDELADRLTMTGLEVDSTNFVSNCDEQIVVGKVNSVSLLNESKGISVCLVDAGRDNELQIVCGAPNVREGGKYPVALPGSSVGGKAIAKVEIYSTTSEGMLCSESELGLGDSAEGLFELDADAPVGLPINSYLNLDDCVLDLELTPNRADCLSVRGVAREVAILANSELNKHAKFNVAAKGDFAIPVQVKNPENCPVFCRRVIKELRSDARTPDWMKQRLQRVGLRSIHPLVDITNYVMMELGQPMHAFDTEVIDPSEIIVRHSEQGEKLVLLDGDSLDLGSGMLLITDRSGPIALAGVMGGKASGIREQTTSIMLEAAYFSPNAIRRSVSKFGLHTDASHRFERGVDPTGQALAIERATELILEIAGGTPGPTQEVRFDEFIEKKKPCRVRHARINRVLGLELNRQKLEKILDAVNESVSEEEDGWSVVPPSYRFDLSEEHDQVEEVARIYGYDNVPSNMNFMPGVFRNQSESVVSHSSMREVLYSLGYHEAITYSFVEPELQSKFNLNSTGFRLSNPIAENLSVMRTSLWPGLIQAFLENYRRSKESVRLYEIGRVFQPDEEVNMIGGINFGSLSPTQWGVEERKVDYFDIKGDVERLIELTGSSTDLDFRVEPIAGLHPGRSANIYLDGQRIGAIGQIHPDLLNEVNSSEAVYVFEFELDAISKRGVLNYRTISRFPSITRDLSLIIDAQQEVSEITSTIQRSAGSSLNSLTLFDVYSELDSGSNIKSVTYRLIYRSDKRTLTDSEVDSKIAIVLNELNLKHNAKLRV